MFRLIWLPGGSKKKKEDTFGQNDADWEVYKEIVNIDVEIWQELLDIQIILHLFYLPLFLYINWFYNNMNYKRNACTNLFQHPENADSDSEAEEDKLEELETLLKEHDPEFQK